MLSTSQFVVAVNVNTDLAEVLCCEENANINWEQFMTFMEEQRAQQEDAWELREREKEAEEECWSLELE